MKPNSDGADDENPEAEAREAPATSNRAGNATRMNFWTEVMWTRLERPPPPVNGGKRHFHKDPSIIVFTLPDEW